MQSVLKYFPDLSPDQVLKFEMLGPLYRNWNKTTHVLPVKELAGKFCEEHILHSLSIARVIGFDTGCRILDVGTGGGFPGVPLAILFPLCNFTLIDAMRKRIDVVNAVIKKLNLKNAVANYGKIEDVFEQYDFVVSRAVAAFPVLVGMVSKNVSGNSFNSRPNGIFYLKSGNFEEEIVDFKNKAEVSEIGSFFPEPSFRTKKVIYLPIEKH